MGVTTYHTLGTNLGGASPLVTYSAAETPDWQPYRFSGKESLTRVGLDLYDFGARMFSPFNMRWMTMDPLCERAAHISPYVYCSGNPINRIDVGGKWDVKVHLYKDRETHGYGVTVVSDRLGNEVYRFDVRAEGAKGRNRMKTGADTPLGVYDIPDKSPWISGGSRKSYGPYPRLNMQGLSGEITESGRSAIRIHGGRQEYKASDGKYYNVTSPVLIKTYGCLRAYDQDIKRFKEIVD